jgi:hypothetical protein
VLRNINLHPYSEKPLFSTLFEIFSTRVFWSLQQESHFAAFLAMSVRSFGF